MRFIVPQTKFNSKHFFQPKDNLGEQNIDQQPTKNIQSHPSDNKKSRYVRFTEKSSEIWHKSNKNKTIDLYRLQHLLYWQEILAE